MILSHDSLFNYYKLNFSLMYFHDYSLTELDGMMPYERELYTAMLSQQIRDENEKLQLRQQEARFR